MSIVIFIDLIIEEMINSGERNYIINCYKLIFMILHVFIISFYFVLLSVVKRDYRLQNYYFFYK